MKRIPTLVSTVPAISTRPWTHGKSSPAGGGPPGGGRNPGPPGGPPGGGPSNRWGPGPGPDPGPRRSPGPPGSPPPGGGRRGGSGGCRALQASSGSCRWSSQTASDLRNPSRFGSAADPIIPHHNPPTSHARRRNRCRRASGFPEALAARWMRWPRSMDQLWLRRLTGASKYSSWASRRISGIRWAKGLFWRAVARRWKSSLATFSPGNQCSAWPSML